MKILVIRGKNLASLEEEFEIDFTTPPLSDAGIFAITGPTGAGKSTILDAMCVALYATSPRIKKAGTNCDIIDTDNYTIKERDTRNILRRGAGNGYAEVDFIGLDGHTYRARWSVRRARDKGNGKLQKSEHALYDLVSNNRFEGDKDEVRDKISELVGLTFDQFTRAVLLAQGDFATFLKANEKDKAEILEKLTGTEIYSKISERIFEKHKQISSELKIIEEKMQDLHLLNEEDVEKIQKEKAELEGVIKEKELLIKTIEKKISWCEREAVLRGYLQEAQKMVETAQLNIAESKGDMLFIERADSVQDIRDTYMALITAEKQIVTEREHLLKNRTAATLYAKEFEETEKETEKKIEEQEELGKMWAEARPKIENALEIENECRNIAQRKREIAEELYKHRKEREEFEKEASALLKAIKQQLQEKAQITEWFEKHERYSEIVEKSEIIVAGITEIADEEKLLGTKTEILKKAEELLANNEKSLQNEKKEAERLNSLLPEEIVILRNSLIEGEPCPVCGSIHHNVEKSIQATLKESALAKAKAEVKSRIEHLENSIEEAKSTINIHKGLIKAIQDSVNVARERVGRLLKPFDEGNGIPGPDFAKELQKIAKKWTDLQTKLAETASGEALNREREKALSLRIEEKQKAEAELETRIANAEKEIEKRIKQIEQLIGTNKSAKELEEAFSTKISTANEAVRKSIEKRGDINAKLEKIKGIVDKIENDIVQLQSTIDKERKATEEFLKARQDNMTIEELRSIVTTDSNKIATLRKKIETLQKSLFMAHATLKERETALKEHCEAENRAMEHESIATLQVMLNETEKERKEFFDKLSDRDSTLKKNEESKKSLANFIEIHAEKTTVCNKWKILNDTFGASDGNKFKVIAQGYTLDTLLGYANLHLKEISNRYRLRRANTDSLAIKIIDRDMLEEERSVYCLSGGETFLVSLALALALSSLSSSKMNIESLFIDEGFGSLDNETLTTAMEVLEKLHIQGRKVGVISHLQEMIERIPVKVEVIKEQEGKSRLNIKW